jgi:homeobox-leucine zipper protein
MIYRTKLKQTEAIDAERASSRARDDEKNGSTWMKRGLSKTQSAFLEASFEAHHSLNTVSHHILKNIK